MLAWGRGYVGSFPDIYNDPHSWPTVSRHRLSLPVAKSTYFLHRDFNLINISGQLTESDRLNLILKFLFLFILDLPTLPFP